MNFFKRLLLGLCAFALLLAFSGRALAQANSSKPQPLNSNTVLLEIQVDGYVLSDSVSAFQLGQKIFLPLGELARLMSIGIRVYPAEGTGRGYIRGENKTFSLNLTNSIVTLAEKSITFDPASVIRQDDDIYVDSRLLADWLLVDFQIDLSSLSVKLNPREPLPLQLRLAREAKLAGLKGINQAVDPNYPKKENPYKLFDAPFVDQTISMGAQRGNGNKANSASYTTYVRGDLAGLQASIFLSGTNQANSQQTRVTFGQNDPQGELLGPLRARSFAFGNVSVPGLPNVSRTSVSGNGFSVSNLPLDRPSRFSSHSLQGNLPPGYDVELYVNNALVAFQQSRADGKYSFDDLSLVYGPNEFRLVFYGPQGQLRVERQNFLLDESINAPSSFFYNVASSRDAIGVHHSAATAEWGLGKTISGSSGVVSLEDVNGRRTQYNSIGLRGFAANAVFVGNLTQQAGGGSLSEFSARTRVAGVSVAWNHLELKNFSSDVFPLAEDPVRTRDRIRLDGALPTGSLAVLPFTLELKRDRLLSGSQIFEGSALLSTSLRYVSLSNQLRFASSPGGRAIDGALQVSGNLGLNRLRGQLSYLVKPEARVSALALSADRSLSEGYRLNVAAVRTFEDSRLRLTSSLNKSLGNYAVALTASAASNREFSVGVQLFVAIGREPRREQLIFSAVPMADSGAVSARVFIDQNGNGIMDEEEQAVKNIGFMVNSSNHPVRTDGLGVAYVGHLPANRNTDIAVNPSTIEDSQLASRLKGMRVIPRPGNVTQIDFPLVLSGEIDGTVYLLSNGAKRGVGNVLVELVNPSGVVVAQARSGSDGFFVVAEVLPGPYSLRIAEEQLKDLKLKYSGARSLTLSPKWTFISGQDFSLERL